MTSGASGRGTPRADVHIDEAGVRRLLAEQHPEFADRPIRALDSGWDNLMFRLGETHVVRLPRRVEAVALIENEHAWLGELAAELPFEAPVPLRIGRPGSGYPWPWSIRRWLTGSTADSEPPDAEEADRWAGFLRRLRRPAPSDAPVNPARGVPLKERAAPAAGRYDRLRAAGHLSGAALDVWDAALDAPPASRRCWLHGDLHPRNVLVENGRITAVIDWGDLNGGDPATDLASVWMLFAGSDTRERCLEAVGADDAEIARAKGWAVHIGAALLETGLVDHPAHARIGAAVLERVVR